MAGWTSMLLRRQPFSLRPVNSVAAGLRARTFSGHWCGNDASLGIAVKMKRGRLSPPLQRLKITGDKRDTDTVKPTDYQLEYALYRVSGERRAQAADERRVLSDGSADAPAMYRSYSVASRSSQ